MVKSFCAVLFPRGVLDEILNLIESVSEEFPSYSSISLSEKLCCQNFITSIKVIDMTGHSSKMNKLRNINTIGCRTRNITI